MLACHSGVSCAHGGRPTFIRIFFRAQARVPGAAFGQFLASDSRQSRLWRSRLGQRCSCLSWLHPPSAGLQQIAIAPCSLHLATASQLPAHALPCAVLLALALSCAPLTSTAPCRCCPFCVAIVPWAALLPLEPHPHSPAAALLPHPKLSIHRIPCPLCSYVAMGCVATLGTDPPPRSCVKCLRADAAARADPARTPLWTVRREARTMPPLSGGWADVVALLLVLRLLVLRVGDPPSAKTCGRASAG